MTLGHLDQTTSCWVKYALEYMRLLLSVTAAEAELRYITSTNIYVKRMAVPFLELSSSFIDGYTNWHLAFKRF